MGATTSAKRGESRRAPSPPSHIQREVIGVILIALSLLMLLSLLSFVPGEAKMPASGASAADPPRNLIGSFGALSAGAFFYGLGGAAYLFPLLLGRVGISLFLPGVGESPAADGCQFPRLRILLERVSAP